MRRNVLVLALFTWFSGVMVNNPVAAQEVSMDQILEELRILKQRINRLEAELLRKQREVEELKGREPRAEEGSEEAPRVRAEEEPLSRIKEHVHLSGLIEFGGAWEGVDKRDGSDESQSDLNLTTLQLTAQAEANDWIGGTVTLLFEDATFGEESDLPVDVATVRFGDVDRFPLYFVGGKMYVPFGALLTHFPDDPLIDQPLTLLLGETSEKAALIVFEYGGLSISGYAFNGDVEEVGEPNRVSSYGLQAGYRFPQEYPLELHVGVGYISNIAEADGVAQELEGLGVTALQSPVGGFNAHLHLALDPFFLDAEYMTATDAFQASELATHGGAGARPAVWNFEGGFHWNWGKDLEIALKYEGSRESEALGFPGDRFGIALNQTIVKGVIASLAYLHDEFDEGDRDGRDKREVLFGQVAAEF